MQFVGDKEAKYKLSIKYKAIYYGNDSTFFFHMWWSYPPNKLGKPALWNARQFPDMQS